MTVVIVAVVAVVTVLVLLVGLLRARRATGAATRRISAIRAELSTARQELQAARERSGELDRQLSEAQQEAFHAKALNTKETTGPMVAPEQTPNKIELDDAELNPAVVGHQRETIDALWSLTRIRQEWASRQSATIGLPDEAGRPNWSADTLGDVLAEEVARIREDTGTPGTLRLALAEQPRPADAVLLVFSVQALLDALSRHCQGYDLYVHEWEQRLTAIVVCEGFDGPDRVAADASSVLGAISPAGGDVALDRDTQGRLRARLSLSVTPG